MIDKMIFKKINETSFEIVLIYDTRAPFRLSANSHAELMTLLDEFLSPVGSQFKTYSEYNVALDQSLEDTVNINLNEVI